ncbi:CheB methylesterase [Desulfovibrio sp. X2]|uniref:chemotaxis protein CheB n=1 Tax=Desulfovibrio sp. X2 TaxID=941449 RepID=UPI000358C736|nr:chemotaxis protein CheB [Desulfovibrio sp. X2]EPR43971.1 CheB methylesterase [Desulfovibrio sp. X2]
MSRAAIRAVAIGASAGGGRLLETILSRLPEGFAPSLLVVLHVHPDQDGFFVVHYDRLCPLPVQEGRDKEPVLPGRVYFAPPGYHLLVERTRTFSLSSDEKVNYARPSIDVLFESAAETYGEGLLGIVLSGANSDGAKGLLRIKELGGRTVVQDPAGAEHPTMPRAALELAEPELVLDVDGICDLLGTLSGDGPAD